MTLNRFVTLAALVLGLPILACADTPFDSMDLGFEQVNSQTLWHQNSAAPFEQNELITSDPNLVHGGEHAMHLVRLAKTPAGDELQGHLHSTNSAEVDSGKSYRLSIFAKGKGTLSMGAYLYKLVNGDEGFHSGIDFPTFDGKPQPPLKGDSEWHEYVFRFDAKTLPAEAQRVRLVIKASGDVVVDDLTITEANASAQSGASDTQAKKDDDSNAVRSNLVTVGSAKAAPKLDGVLSPGEYPSLLSGLIDNETRDIYPYQNQVGFSYDQNRLYIAMQLHLPPGYQPVRQGKGNDDPTMVVSADTLFFMLREDAKPQVSAYKGAYTAVDTSGAIYDAMEKIDWKNSSCQRDAAFNAQWAVKTVVADDGTWTTELSAPWSGLQLPAPKPGQRLLLSLGVKLRDRILTWQSFSNWFDHYSAFGILRFDPNSVRVQVPDLAGLARGQLQPSFHLTNDSGKEKTYDLTYLIAKPRMVGGGIGAWVYDSAIDARRKDIVRGQSVYLWDRSGKLAAGKEVTETETHQLPDPAYYVLEIEARADKEPVYYQRVPFRFLPPIRVTLSPVPSKKIVEVTVDLRGTAPELRKQLVVELASSGGKPGVRKQLPVTAPELTVPLPIDDLQAGDHPIVLATLDAKSTESSRITVSFHKPEDPDWLIHPAGLESRSADWVPTPWTPVQVNNNAVSVWARTFQFEKGSLIGGITSQDKRVLASPAVIKYARDGREESIALATTRIQQAGEGRAIVSQSGTSASLGLEATQTIEFDGMNLIELTLTPRQSTRLESLWIEIPLADAEMSVIQSRTGIGTFWWQRGVPSDATFEAPRRYDSIWIGNERAGLVYFIDSYKGWLIDSRKPRVRLSSEGNTRTLKLMLVNTPTQVSAPIKVRFGVQPTPFKPMMKGMRGYRPDSDFISPAMNLYLTHSSAWNSSDSKPTPRTWEMFNELVTHYHKRNTRVNPYVATYNLGPWDFYRRTIPFNERRESFPSDWLWLKKEDATRVEEYDYFQRDWHTTPKNISPAEPETRDLVAMAAGTSYDDYFAGGVRDMLTKSDFDGFFMDISCPILNFDESRGQVYTTLDGVREGTFDGLGTRDLYKRLYWLFEKHRGDARRPWMIGHNLPSSAPYASFWDMTVNGEEIKTSSTFEFTKLMAARTISGDPMAAVAAGESDITKDPVAWRSAFGGQFGLGNIILPQYGYNPALKTPEHAREVLSVTFIHNELVWPGFITSQTFYDFWGKVEVPFDLSDAEFHGYWSNGIQTDHPAVRASYWKKAGKESYLLGVSNWDAKDISANVQLPSGFESVTELTDMESGEVVAIKGGKIALDVPLHNLRVLRFHK